MGVTTPKILVVDRPKFRLHFWRRPLLSWRKYEIGRSFKIAVGAIGYETPAGLYFIQSKSLNPNWYKPSSEWVPKEEWGQVVPPGPDNPLKVAFLSIYQGVGIHGTDNIGSLGTKASHGCIRMHPDSVKWLYDQVPVGTPVVIL